MSSFGGRFGTFRDGANRRRAIAALLGIAGAAQAAPQAESGPAVAVGGGAEYGRLGVEARWYQRLGPAFVVPWGSVGLPRGDDVEDLGPAWMAGLRVVAGRTHRALAGAGAGVLRVRALHLHGAYAAGRASHGLVISAGYELMSARGLFLQLTPALAVPLDPLDGGGDRGVYPTFSAALGWKPW